MFEDSTFESQGRIRTRSRAWMLATLAFNGSVLMALILIPLIYTNALPRQATSFLMQVPPPPVTPPPAREIVRTITHINMQSSQIMAPPSISRTILIPRDPEGSPVPNEVSSIANLDLGSAVPGSARDAFNSSAALPVVHRAASGPVRISSGVAASTLIRKDTPVYPAIAIAARIDGTVVLAATISKSGTIENLRAVGGPVMLQQAAIEAVKQWRYRPYLLNGEPVEVETTVNVVFTLGR